MITQASVMQWAQRLPHMPHLDEGSLYTQSTVKQFSRTFVKISTAIHADAAKYRDATTVILIHEIHLAPVSLAPFRLRNPPCLIITGALASGKRTQCELLVRVLHFVHLSPADMLRQAIRDGTSLGKQAQGYKDNDQLVPDGACRT